MTKVIEKLRVKEKFMTALNTMWQFLVVWCNASPRALKIRYG